MLFLVVSSEKKIKIRLPRALTWGWYNNESSSRLVIVAVCALGPRNSGIVDHLVSSYQRNHCQGFPETHWICDNAASEWRRFVSLMCSSDSIDEALWEDKWLGPCIYGATWLQDVLCTYTNPKWSSAAFQISFLVELKAHPSSRRRMKVRACLWCLWQCCQKGVLQYHLDLLQTSSNWSELLAAAGTRQVRRGYLACRADQVSGPFLRIQRRESFEPRNLRGIDKMTDREKRAYEGCNIWSYVRQFGEDLEDILHSPRSKFRSHQTGQPAHIV